MGRWRSFHGSGRSNRDIHIQRHVQDLTTFIVVVSYIFNGVGYRVSVWGTIPGGTGINSINVSVDGGTASTINRTSNGTVVYNELYFISPLLREASHTIVVTNQGSNVNGNSEFMLDRFLFETGDEVPVFPTTAGTSTSTSTSAASSSYVAIPYDCEVCTNFSPLTFSYLAAYTLPLFWTAQHSRL